VLRIISAGIIGLFVATTGVATAQDAQSADNAAMARKVRKLGLRIGNAYACTDEKARDAFKGEGHHLFDLIVQDVGSDLGFAYAISLGIGSTSPKEKLDCKALLKDWQEIREDYELKGDK